MAILVMDLICMAIPGMTDRKLVHGEVLDGVTVLRFDGSLKNINEDSISSILDEFLSFTASGQPQAILLDLDGIEFFGSSFIEVLFRLWKKLKENGGRFGLCNVAPYCAEIFEVTNLDRVWKLYPNRDAALAALHVAE